MEGRKRDKKDVEENLKLKRGKWKLKGGKRNEKDVVEEFKINNGEVKAT